MCERDGEETQESLDSVLLYTRTGLHVIPLHTRSGKSG